MSSVRVGILHPGAMGASVAAAAKSSGAEVYWASDGRSPETLARATQVGLRDLGTVGELCRTCDVLMSICPPEAAEGVAEMVLSHSFRGLFVDANAISPQRAVRIGQRMADAGVDFVDGSIFGTPAWKPGKAWLLLSGTRTEDVAALFGGSLLGTVFVGDQLGRASALKMCYAAYSKGRGALLCGILAVAEKLGVRDELNRQWAHVSPGFDEEAAQRVLYVTDKAWRFVGEMEEVSSTFREAGLPGEFHAAAAATFRRLAGFKDAATTPALEEVLDALLREDQGT